MKLRFFRTNRVLFSGLESSGVTSSSMTIKGRIIWCKTYTACGVAYKAGSGSWTHVASDGKDVEESISELQADTTYTVALYLKRASKYDYSSTITVKTAAAETSEE